MKFIRGKVRCKVNDVEYIDTPKNLMENEDFWVAITPAVVFCENYEIFRKKLQETSSLLKVVLEHEAKVMASDFANFENLKNNITSLFGTNIEEVDIMKLFLSKNNFYKLSENQQDFVKKAWYFSKVLRDALQASENITLGF